MLTMSAFPGKDFPWHFTCISAGSVPGWAGAIPEESKEPHPAGQESEGTGKENWAEQDPALQNLSLIISNSDIAKRDFSRKNGLRWNEEYPLFNEIATILSSL